MTTIPKRLFGCNRAMPPSVADIIDVASRRFNVLPEQILSRQTAPEVTAARYHAIRLTRSRIKIRGEPASHALIGKWFGRHRTLVLYACRIAE